jgi:hypothetical protein
MHVAIDTNTLVNDDHTLRPGAVEVIEALLRQGNSVIYYTPHKQWLDARLPSGSVYHYTNAINKLLTLYECEHECGSIALIDAAWQESISELHRLTLGEHAIPHSYAQAAAAWLAQYLFLVAYGPHAVVNSVLPVMLRMQSWQEAEELLRLFSGSGD